MALPLQLWLAQKKLSFTSMKKTLYLCGRKCSLYPEHMIQLPLGSACLTHSLYIHYINLSILKTTDYHSDCSFYYCAWI